MKFLFVLEHFEPYLGGAEKLFGQVTRMLVQNGHEVKVITTLHDRLLPRREVLHGVKVQRVRCFNRFFFTIASLPAAWRASKQVDIIHTTTYNAAISAWFAGKMRAVPTLITFHEYWGKLWFDLPFLRFWQRLLYYSFERLVAQLRFDHYVAVSDATKSSLLAAGIPGSKITRVYNGIDYSVYQKSEGPKDDFFSSVFVGRLGVSKGLDLLLPAWGAFVTTSEGRGALLRLVVPRYPKPMLRKVQDLIARHCSQNSVEVLHELSNHDLSVLMQKSHAIIIPSYTEGFCFVAAEAAAQGMAIISSGKKALDEVVSGRYIVMREQSVPALLEAMVKARNGKWQYRPPRVFPLSASSAAYLSLYKSLIPGHP